MKSLLTLTAIALIVFGIAVLGYQGFTYTKHEEVAQIGSLQITADREKTVYFPPVAGGAALAAGIVLLVLSRRNR